MITLIPKTPKGKNRIREHGNQWEIIDRRERVACLNGGPGILIRSPDGHIRWIDPNNDVDFKLAVLI